MKILQLLPGISRGDGVSLSAFQIDQVLKGMKIDTMIYAENIGNHIPEYQVKPFHLFPRDEDDYIVIFHVCGGSPLNDWVCEQKFRVIMVYHNITPPEFFHGYNARTRKSCERGLKQVEKLSSRIDYCLAVSEFNKSDLRRMGYKCKIDVMPTILPFEDYNREPDFKFMKLFQDDYVNIAFVGRICPHKKQEDIIQSFYYYKKYINPKSRLFIIGSVSEKKYFLKLKKYIKKLKLDDVFFGGHMSFEKILACYRLADIFLCMSEHEGFCLPLLEAMHFRVPIIAYAAAAVPETLNGTGVLMKEKNPKVIAEVIELVIKNQEVKEQMVQEQSERLKDFQYDALATKFELYIRQYLNENERRKDA